MKNVEQMKIAPCDIFHEGGNEVPMESMPHYITFKDVLKKFNPITERTDFYEFFGYFGNRAYDDEFGYMPCRATVLEMYWDKIPNDQKYDHFVETYIGIHATHSHRWMSKKIKEIRKYRPHDLASNLEPYADEGEILTVYRGGGFEAKPYLSYSWSLSREVAEKFARVAARLYADGYVYTGHIKIKDVAAYTNARAEQEIIQVQKVFDIAAERISA